MKSLKKLKPCLLKIIISFSLLLFISIIISDFSKGNNQVLFEKNVVNDVTKLNPTVVLKIIKPISTSDIVSAIKNSKGMISIGGGRFSQGGQISYKDSIHLDMRSYNKIISINQTHKQITVQSGITWRDIQEIIDPKGLSIQIMQTYANFTVGGSLSVNAHGRYINKGPIINSVESIKLVMANGSIVTASPLINSDIFYGAIGGYGGIGVIAEVTLNLTNNIKLARNTNYMPVDDYINYFSKNVISNDDVILHNADIYPPNYKYINSVSWAKTNEKPTVNEKLIPKNKEYTWQPKVMGFIASSNVAKLIRQHILEPFLYSFKAVHWLNYEASYDVKELEPKSRIKSTYALREYFIPVKNFNKFLTKMSKIFKKHDVNVVNVSVRHSPKDSKALLSWAKSEVFSFVVYYKQGTDKKSIEAVKHWSKKMIDAAISEKGSYYLPYQLNATKSQFLKSYPRASEFFKLKKKVDPTNRFINKLWAQHYLK